MFVKILRYIEDGRIHETVYECVKVSSEPVPIDENPNLTKWDLHIDIGNQIIRTIMIDSKDKTEVILMNNNGKTIDRKVYVINNQGKNK